MRSAVLLAVFVLLVACSPQPPTGNTVARSAHWENGDPLIIAQPLSPVFDMTPVRVSVQGDLVYSTLIVDGASRNLSGDPRSGPWLSGPGTAVVYLSPGEHELRAYSCFDTLTGWECGCKRTGDCGHWVARTITVSLDR